LAPSRLACTQRVTQRLVVVRTTVSMQASALPNPWGLDGDELQVGFAKLQGARMEYVIQKHTVSMGRHSKTSNVDLVLGDNMNLSRHHADIAFNFDSGCFELQVKGKNGVSVAGKFVPAGSDPIPLRSQDLVQVADMQFYFLLPPVGTGDSKRPREAEDAPADDAPEDAKKPKLAIASE